MAVSPEFAKAMVILAEAYGNVSLTPERIEIYASAMSDLDMAQVRHVMGRAVRGCRFFPTVAELRSYVEGTTDDSALVAWAKLQQSARDVGAYADLLVDDPAAADALRTAFGTWPAFCQSEDGPELAMKRQEFLAAYRLSCKAAVSRAGTVRLEGQLRLSGSVFGQPAQPWSGPALGRAMAFKELS